MSSRNWKTEILTIPNLLSLFRLVLIPVYVHLYLRAQTGQDYIRAGTVMAVSCLTDLADGKIARQFHMISQVGKVLDPLADKLTQLALFLCLSTRYPLLYPVLALFLVKELFQLFAFLLCLRKGKALSGALMAGKVCTAVLFISLIALVLLPDLNRSVANLLVLTDGAFLTVSFWFYVRAYCGNNRQIRDLESE